MKKINIYCASKDVAQRKEVYSYIKENILKTYGSYPAPLDPDMLLIYAQIGGKVVGSIGVYLGGCSNELPYQKVIDNAKSEFSLLGRISDFAFVSRWTSTEGDIGMLLTYYAALYIERSGRSVALCFLKPRILTYLNVLSNNSWSHVGEVAFDKKKIHKTDYNYFFTGQKPFFCKCEIPLFLNSISNRDRLQKLIKKVIINF